MTREIKPKSVTVDDSGRLVVVLSEEQPDQWRGFFANYWQHPTTIRTAFNRSVLAGWTDSGPILKATVDEFKLTYRDVVLGAAQHANERMKQAEAAQVALEHTERETQDRGRQELEKERQKASEITFD